MIFYIYYIKYKDKIMNWISVSSSNISSLAHEGNPDILYVQFHDGSVYQYHGVSAETFQEMLDSHSQGIFLNTNIKGNYSYNKM